MKNKPAGWEGISVSSVWNGKTWKPVKNLGWLLRHSASVDSFEVTISKLSGRNATLIAFMHDGSVYVSPFTDRTVLSGWLARRAFRGMDLVWFGTKTQIGA